MTPEEFAQLLALGHETQGIEFKAQFSLQENLLASPLPMEGWK